MASLEVALVGVKQPEVLLCDLLVNLRALNHLVKHFEQLEAREEGGVVFEALGNHRGDTFVDVLHLSLEGAEVLAELLAGRLVVDIHDVLVLAVEVCALVLEGVVGEGLECIVEHVVNVFDIFSELVSLGSSDGDFLETVVVHCSLDDMFEVCAALDVAVEFFEQGRVYNIPAAV